VQLAAAGYVHREVEECGHHHAADRGDHRQCRIRRIAQFAGDQLTFELDTGDEEEDRQQPVGSPVLHRQIESDRRDPEVEVADLVVGLAQRCVGPQQRHHGSGEQHHAADRLRAQGVREDTALAWRRMGKDVVSFCALGGWRHQGWPPADGSEKSALRCRPDFPAHLDYSLFDLYAVSSPYPQGCAIPQEALGGDLRLPASTDGYGV
jgi:hypothetical protein